MALDDRDYIQDRRRKEFNSWQPLERESRARQEGADAIWDEVEGRRPSRKENRANANGGSPRTAFIVWVGIFALLGAGAYFSARPTHFLGKQATTMSSPKQAPLPLPANSSYVARGMLTEAPAFGSLTIRNAEPRQHMAVTFVDASGLARLEVFIEAGQEATTQLPTGSYAMSVQSGTRWYGFENKFSPEAVRAPQAPVRIDVREETPLNFEFTVSPSR